MKKAGFTMIELAIVLGVLATIVGLITVNVLKASSKASVQTAATTLVSDIKQQQLLAMQGQQPQGAADDFGIHFTTSSYTLFTGSAYNPANSTNFVIQLADNLSFSSLNIPNNSIIFSKSTGDVSGFSSTQNAITLSDSNANQQQTIEFNRRGVVTNVY